ncbi:ribosomal protein L13 [Cymbomonas tetramitiformis]|uniref:Ribosomal protein L13 n=1 Tax=Cymbomonas tetramitiformis TaxID=36881 RepID=A0AAE0L7K2_9CHLO|nr:ribosomal protein L13 [Cymbomonas tetramitiformis]|eukprot:gene11877-14029_t
MEKVVVIDARAHMYGRLASTVAKQLLIGQHVVIVRAEAVTMSGGLVRQKMKFSRFLRLRMNTKPSKGPIHFRSPARILWRSIRGMIPHKTKRGASALERLKVFEGIPQPYDKMKRVVVPDALKILRMQSKHKFCTLGRLASEVGWKYGEVLGELEQKRLAESKEYYVAKKASKKAVADAQAGAAKQLGAAAGLLTTVGM